MIMERFINGHPHKVGSPFFLVFIFRCRLKLSLIAEFVIIISANQRSQTRAQINVSKAILSIWEGHASLELFYRQNVSPQSKCVVVGIGRVRWKVFIVGQEVCTVTTRLYIVQYLSNTGGGGGWWSVNMNGQLSP